MALNAHMSHFRSLAFLAGIIVLPLMVSAEPVDVETKPVVLNPDNPKQQRVGQLHFRGGFEFASPDRHFGGFSSLGVSDDGTRLVSISDAGRRLAAKLIYDAEGNLNGLNETHLDTLSNKRGRPLAHKTDQDAESMSPGVDGEIIVSFERNHRIWRYLPGETVPRPLQPPAELAAMPSNGGIEALTLLNDGSLLAISEGPTNATEAVAWVSDAGGWSVMTYATSGGFRVTGAATLPSGDVLVLERRFTLRDGVAIRVRKLASATIEPGAALEASLLAEFRPPLSVDNFEGIEVRKDDRGKTHVYLISDDNFNPLQRNLLMMFELME